MAPIPVRFNFAVAVGLLVCGAFVLLTGLMLGTGMQLIVGGLNVAVGLGYMTQPWFIVHADHIEVKNLLGMTMKTHQFEGLQDLEVVDNKVRSKSGTFKLGGFMARGEDLAKVQQALSAA